MQRERVFPREWEVMSLLVLLLFNLSVASCLAQDQRGLVAHWKFDEGKGGKLIDASGNNNHGTIHGASWTAGRIKGGLQFDGVDDYVDVPKSPSLDSIKKEITMMCWIKSPLTDRHSILERWFYAKGVNQRCLELDVNKAKEVNFFLSSNGISASGCVSSGKIPANEWTHIAVTSDGEKIRIYVNGDLDPSTDAAPSRIHPAATNLHIGGWYAAVVNVTKWNTMFKGAVDEVRIYSRALTHEEILGIYREQSPTGIVTGKVIDIKGESISGVRVCVGQFAATTDKAGVYKILVPARTYKVIFSGKGYKRETKPNVKVKAGKTNEANILLTEDKAPPSISGVKTEDVASVTAVVLWETDEPCSGRIKYGTSPGRHRDTARDPFGMESHRMILTGLKPDTRYYFVVEGTDGAENSTRSKEYAFTTQKKGGVILWDSREKHTKKHATFLPYKNRALWKQVPYGAKDYQFAGSAVLENEFFYIYFHHNSFDAIELYAKRDGGLGILGNEIYKRYYDKRGRMKHGHGTKYVKVIKTSPDEVIVEHQAAKYPCTSTHRVVQGKPWVEIKAIRDIHTQGIHGKTRIDIVPVEGGNDYVIDSLRRPNKYYRPAGKIKEAKMVLCLYESIKYPFMWVFTFPSFSGAGPCINCDSGGPRTDAMSWWMTSDGPATPPNYWFSEPNWPRRSRGCIASTHAYFGRDMTAPVVIGALTYWHNWNREELGMPIKAGQEYKSKWKPPYPGRWRMTIRIAEKKYDQGWEYDGKTKFPAKYFSRDVYDGNFTFESPIDGVLDYVLMYMYDRTKDTPVNILTPMDQYRWTVQQKK